MHSIKISPLTKLCSTSAGALSVAAREMSSHHRSEALTKNYVKLALQNAHLAKQRLINPGKLETVLTSAYSCSMYNPRSMITPEGIIKLNDMTRILSFFGVRPDFPQSYMDTEHVDCMLFIVSIKLDTDPQIYDTKLSKALVRIVTDLVYVGSTSFKHVSQFYFPGVQKPLARCEMQTVTVDKTSHRPQQPPGWWREKYTEFSQPGEKSLILPTVDLGPECWEQSVVIKASDLDQYCHTSHVLYVRFYMDAYIHWHVKTFGFEGNGDPFRKVKSMSQTLKGDAEIGDEVLIRLRPREESKDIFDFLMLKDSRPINYCTIEFHPNHLSKY